MDLATIDLADGWPWALVSALGLGLLGTIFGSFIGALVVRWPVGRSVLRGRSACDGCAQPLSAVDLVPLLSALWLRGRCRHCAAPIDPVHRLAELLALVAGAVAGLVLPGLTGVVTAMFGWLLIALALLDVRAFWLPDRLTLPLAIGGLAVGLAGIGPPIADRLIGGAAGFAAFWAIGAGYRMLRHREGLGGGDPKLLGAIGLWVGWQMLPVIVVLASMTGLGVVLFRLLTGRLVQRDDRLPLGTLLAVAAYPTWIAMLWAAI